MATDNAWIGERLKALRRSKGALARAMGVDPARISEIVGGRRNVQVAELAPMAKMLEMTTEELVARLAVRAARPITEAAAERGEGTPAQPIALPGGTTAGRDLPLYGSAMGGVDGAFEMNGQAMDFVERPAALAGARSAYAVFVQGDSMAPRFEAGWLLHVNPTRPVRRGDNVVVQVRGPDRFAPPLAYVKVFEARTPSRLIVRQFNPPGELSWRLDDVVSVHRVVGVAEM